MSELKPCPFCGGEASTIQEHGWWVVCTDCSAEVGFEGMTDTSGCYGSYQTEAEAIEAWNTRTDDYRQAAEYWQRMYEEAFAERTCQDVNEEEDDFTCSACGASMFTQIDDTWVMIAQDGDDDDLIWKPNYCPNCGAKVVSE